VKAPAASFILPLALSSTAAPFGDLSPSLEAGEVTHGAARVIESLALPA
jgi:hypothetical protein